MSARDSNGIFRVLLAVFVLLSAGRAHAFDQSHAAWDGLLKRHVVVARDGNSARVDYAGLRGEQGALQAYLHEMSAVPQAEFQGWNREQRLAFLIDAYNAFTVELILTRYPDLKSIKDLGGLLSSPWKKQFFTLLGKPRSLDDVEHGLIRAPGAFDEPRIHFAVNCASVGCPMLRAEAYVAERLNAQLDDAARHFLSDRSRNRLDAASGALEVSKIFDWYGADFAASKGAHSVAGFLARYAELLADGQDERARVREGRAPLRYLDYDWALNDARR
jgi:hypothetical protein